MCELSAADGFVEIHESLGDMIKYVANEPSVGLYYIQQHAQNAVPNVMRLKNNVMQKSHELSLQTEDLEDSIAVTRSMKECGSPIIDEMVKDIKTSLTIMSIKHPVRGLIQQRSSSYQTGGSTSWGPVTWARSSATLENDSEKAGGYFSSVFKTAKEKAGNLKWPQLDLKELRETVGGDLTTCDGPQLLAPSRSNSSDQPDEADELPLSSQVEEEIIEDGNAPTDGESHPELSRTNDYDEYKADREAKLEEWLKDTGGVLDTGDSDAEGHKLDSL